MQKALARHLIITKLRNSPRHDHRRLYRQLFNTVNWQRSRTVAVTMSTSIELNTTPIIQRAWQTGKAVVIPKIFPHRQMKFFIYNHSTSIRRNRFGILEPFNSPIVPKERIDLIIVPGLGFSKSGWRLGFGGGYYDRYLKNYPGYTVALARSEQIFDPPIWPVDKYDRQVQAVLYE